MSPDTELGWLDGRWPRILALISWCWLVASTTFGAPPSRSQWCAMLDQQLRVLGHRNWIVIADSAYPAQVSPGIETFYIGGDQLEAVQAVLERIDAAKHVRAIVHTDAELPHVSEPDAAGITAYRTRLKNLLNQRTVRELPHDDIIAELDAAGRTFKVLILKTDLRLPYTSVFLELDCGYWSSDAEKRLREAMGKE